MGEAGFFMELQEACDECANWLEREINPLPMDAVIELHNVKGRIQESFQYQELVRRNKTNSNRLRHAWTEKFETLFSKEVLLSIVTLTAVVICLAIAQFLCTTVVTSVILMVHWQQRIGQVEKSIRSRIEVEDKSRAPVMRLLASLTTLRSRLDSLCSSLEDLRRSEDPNEAMVAKGVRLLRIGYFLQQFKTARRAVTWMKQGIELTDTFSTTETVNCVTDGTLEDDTTTIPKSSHGQFTSSSPSD